MAQQNVKKIVDNTAENLNTQSSEIQELLKNLAELSETASVEMNKFSDIEFLAIQCTQNVTNN